MLTVQPLAAAPISKISLIRSISVAIRRATEVAGTTATIHCEAGDHSASILSRSILIHFASSEAKKNYHRAPPIGWALVM